MKYKPRHIISAVRKPDIALGEINKIGLNVNQKVHSKVPRRGISVPDQDWDTLVVLDGCRYDMFEELNSIEGDLRSVISKGSESNEYLSENFAGRSLHDTIYITANPYAANLPGDTFYQTINLLNDHWDSQTKTVLPSTVVEKTIEVHREHPNKRLIAHFMQPHYPFIGNLGKEIQHKGIVAQQSIESNERHIWSGLLDNQTENSLNLVIAAYYENLQIVLPYVEKLHNSIDGKTVVTADHGNLLGDRLWPIPTRGFGHPPRLRMKDLVRVPWLEITGKRRKTTVEPPIQDEAVDEDVIGDRLRALGYASE